MIQIAALIACEQAIEKSFSGDQETSDTFLPLWAQKLGSYDEIKDAQDVDPILREDYSVDDPMPPPIQVADYYSLPGTLDQAVVGTYDGEWLGDHNRSGFGTCIYNNSEMFKKVEGIWLENTLVYGRLINASHVY